MNKMDEKVICSPTVSLERIGMFHGITQHSDYMDFVMDALTFRQFIRRGDCEDDPNYKQLIPFCILTSSNRVFRYTRSGDEKRLGNLLEIGIGGHVNEQDYDTTAHWWLNAIWREITEETGLAKGSGKLRQIGYINVEDTPVGKVHFGIIYELALSESEASEVKAGDGISHPEWVERENLGAAENYGGWAKMIIPNLDWLLK